MSKEMLINVSEGEECRIALLEKGRLQELYMERTSATSHVGNIYKGRVTNVEASIQAAFIDFGLGRNGFLHISDLMPSYFGRDGGDIQESVGRKLSRRDRPPIQRCLRRGDEIIVQIIKEGIGTKGPTLSTYISIPGRILVMMPGMGKFGVSRKIEDDEERHRLRMILDGLKPIKDVGFIIRTAGIGKTGQEIERDLTYLTRLWENIQRKMRESAPVELYTEGDLVTRTVRDAYSSDLSRIVVDNLEVGKRIQEFFKIAMPKNRARIELYDSPVPLFHQANIEREIEQMNSRHVPLPSGGSLVIDSTEAVVAIDVNSGKFRDHNDAEMTAFKTDMEAADEIPRQLKLRDLGGVIICDFIDLRFERNRRELEERLHANFKNDRAKTKVLRMSQFGIIEITRQRMRPSLKRSIYFDCPHCKGGGLVKTPESMSLDVMRRLAIAAYDPRVARIELTVGAEVGVYVLNKKRAELTELEGDSGRRIIVRQNAALSLDDMKLMLFDARDGNVYLEELGMDANEDRDEEPRRNRPMRGRSGRPLPPRRGQMDRDDAGEPDELDSAEDAVDRLEGDLDGPPAAVPLKPRAISRVPLGRVIGKLLTDDGGLFDERESSVIEVDEPHEPLGDGPEEFEEDRSRPPRFDRNRQRGPDRFDNRRGPVQPNMPGNLRPPGRFRSGPPAPMNRANGPVDDADMDRDPAAPLGDRPDEGNGINGDGLPRRRRRRGRRGRGRGGQGPDGQRPPMSGNGPGDGAGNAARDEEDEFPDREHADAAFGTSDSDSDHEHDSVGSAGEEIDADAIDSEFDDGEEGQPADRGVNAPGSDDRGAEGDRPRRRRRRGGRRHRRRQEGDAPVAGIAAGDTGSAPSAEDAIESDDADSDGDDAEDRDAEDRIVDITPFPPVAEDEFDDAREALNDTLSDSEASPSLEAREIEAGIHDEPSATGEGPEEPLVRSPGVRRGRARSPQPGHIADKEAAAPAIESEPAGDEEVSGKPKRRGTRGGTTRGTRRAPRKPPATEAAAPQPVVPVERTGSTDRHLVDDVPIDPEPPRRPRSYQDLDAVPDDFD